MHIGIDASRAFLKRRTGIEEYAYQTIKHLSEVIPHSDTVTLYVRRKITWQEGRIVFVLPEIGFPLPSNFRMKGMWAPRFWTQIRLSLEMLMFAPNVLFVPAHTIPLIHPRRTVVTIHGLEYEFCKESYSLLDRLYMRLSIRFSCAVAEKIICVSENTKKDVKKLYHAKASKMHVIYEGYETNFQFLISNFQSISNNKISNSEIKKFNIESKFKIQNSKFILFIGRLEERKNVIRIIEAFEILKKEYRIPHTLVLAGKPGYGYEKIKEKRMGSKQKEAIRELGYITEEEKWDLLRNADVFLFPSLYEGFGIPVLEAQSVGVPVVMSGISSLPEVGGKGAIYVDPMQSEALAQGVYTLLSEREVRDDIIAEGTKNVHLFSWEKCAKEIYQVLSVS